jgi:hypothetical protein
MEPQLRLGVLLVTALVGCLAARQTSAEKSTFHGYACTKDCSGHIAGYQWAEKHGITNSGNCGGKSLSFIQGCLIYANEHQEAALRAQRLRLSQVRSCSNLSDECRRACEAASELENAAQRLAACAEQQALDDSCDSRFREVKYAHDDYEDAVSNGSCKE